MNKRIKEIFKAYGEGLESVRREVGESFADEFIKEIKKTVKNKKERKKYIKIVEYIDERSTMMDIECKYLLDLVEAAINNHPIPDRPTIFFF